MRNDAGLIYTKTMSERLGPFWPISLPLVGPQSISRPRGTHIYTEAKTHDDKKQAFIMRVGGWKAKRGRMSNSVPRLLLAGTYSIGVAAVSQGTAH